MAPAHPIVLAVLAAGGGSRFHGPGHKLGAPLGDTTVVARSIASALAAARGPVIVVTGDYPVTVPDGVTACPNPNWRQGLATSLQVAVAHARRLGATRLVVGLGDQPLVTPDAWRVVSDAEARVAVATYGGTRGNPVGLDVTCWDDLPASGDEGARTLMREHPDWVVEIPCVGAALDVDTVEDLVAVQRQLAEGTS